MHISIAQIKPKLSRDNIEKHLEYIFMAKESKSNIIIFPELSLNGYNLMDSVYEDAFEIDELEVFLKQSKDIDILLGVALREKDKIYNSAIYFSKEEIVNIHHKNTLPNYGMFEEARFFFKGSGVKSFEIDSLKAVTVICEDLWNTSIIDEIVKLRLDLIYVISASPARGFKGNELAIAKKWRSILTSVALLSGAYVVYVNRVGFEDGMGFWGGSQVINPRGEIEAEVQLFKEEFLDIKLSKQLSKTQKYLLRIG